MQQKLFEDFYDDIDISPTTVEYVETHGTGTIVGDPIECQAIDAVFCRNRAQPLLIGSVKSNMGHSEPCSGICSVAKAIVAFENGVIPPTRNFERARPNIAALIDRRMIVCDKRTPFDGEHIAINSFGFGGANAHALFGRNGKVKIDNGRPDDDLPRLVTWTGRTEEAVYTVLNALEAQPLDAEYIGLLHSTQSHETSGYIHRGYTVLATNGADNAVSLAKGSGPLDGQKLPVVWLFAGMGAQWTSMGKSMMIFSQFRAAIELCDDVLKAQDPNIDLVSVITSDDPNMILPIVHSFVGICAIQIGLVDLLRALDMPMDFCIGFSAGELA